MKRIIYVLVMCVMAVGISACGPALVDQLEEVQSNETAFVVPLEGNTSDQKQLMSISYLNNVKVATKRIYLKQTKIKTGRFWWSYRWVPTIRVITVDRRPITFDWSTPKQSIKVESRDSIGFSVGTNISAFINEEDTATFLYYYPSGNLEKVLSNEIFSQATEVLSREFAKYDLEGSPAEMQDGKVKVEAVPGAREQKGAIVDIAKKQLTNYFAAKGVTITTFGLVGGLLYDNEEIQSAINHNFKSELDIVNKRNERLAQKEVNEKEQAQAHSDTLKAQEFARATEARTKQIKLEVALLDAQTRQIFAKKWSGNLPANIMPENSNFMFSMKTTAPTTPTTPTSPAQKYYESKF